MSTNGKRSQQGLTLIEIMVVVVILGILATLVVTQIAGRKDQASVTAARVQIKNFEQALDLFKLDNDFYPSTGQGLEALVRKPTAGRTPKKWNPQGYLKSRAVPKDPWGNSYVYICPGKHGPCDIISYGRDGREGGEGYDADVRSWELDGDD